MGEEILDKPDKLWWQQKVIELIYHYNIKGKEVVYLLTVKECGPFWVP